MPSSLPSHLVDFLIRSLATSRVANSAWPSLTRFSLADRTSPCQGSEGTDSGLRHRSSHNCSITASLSDVVILSKCVRPAWALYIESSTGYTINGPLKAFITVKILETLPFHYQQRQYIQNHLHFLPRTQQEFVYPYMYLGNYHVS